MQENIEIIPCGISGHLCLISGFEKQIDFRYPIAIFV